MIIYLLKEIVTVLPMLKFLLLIQFLHLRQFQLFLHLYYLQFLQLHCPIFFLTSLNLSSYKNFDLLFYSHIISSLFASFARDSISFLIIPRSAMSKLYLFFILNLYYKIPWDQQTTKSSFSGISPLLATKLSSTFIKTFIASVEC